MIRAKTARLVVCLAAVFGCSPAQDAVVFALVPKAMNNPFFDRARDGCKQVEAELPRVECLYVGPGEHSEEEQVRIVQDLITRRVDGIAVAPSNAPAIARALERAEQVGIPVITWDSDLLPEDRALRHSYVGTRNYEIGVEQARALQERKRNGGSLCIQSGGPAAANHNERMQGLRDTLAGAASAQPPGPRLTGQEGWHEVAGCPLYSHDDFPLAVSQMEDVFGRFPDLDAFVATGGFPQFVEGAYRRLARQHEARIRHAATVIVVADTLPMQMALLEDGLSHAQIGQRPFEMGRQAMLLLLELSENRPVPDPVHTGLDVCVQENAARCLEAP
jgi:ribose transport system substrate-binding protein